MLPMALAISILHLGVVQKSALPSFLILTMTSQIEVVVKV